MSILLTDQTTPLPFADRLAAAVQKTGSVTCVGLDPRMDQLPDSIQKNAADGSPDVQAAAYTQFCCEVIDVVKGRVACVKPQAAFFEQLGPAGMVSLSQVIRHASAAGLLVITDAKRNDIGSTATAYAHGYLGASSGWGSDALTVSPYLGRDSLEPFVDVCDQTCSGIFVLVKTSNPGGGLLQDRISDGQSVYQRVAELVSELNQNRRGSSGYGPVGAVVGATYPHQLAALRQAMPDSWILIPGFGAQGGSAADVLPGFDCRGSGAIVNNSRNLIFAYRRTPFVEKYGPSQWQEAVSEATDEMNAMLSERS